MIMTGTHIVLLTGWVTGTTRAWNSEHRGDGNHASTHHPTRITGRGK